MKEERSKNSTWKSDFYLPIINGLKHSTNLSKIQKELSISKQQLNYYLRRLKKHGFIIQKGRGWYEPSKKSKNLTKYGIFLKKDISRGHAYVWNVNIPQEIKDWDKRIKILEDKKINHKIVGAKENTPRIKILGRKVWLCNDHLRIFDKKDASYYGETAIESRYSAFQEIKLIVDALNRKLGILIKPSSISFQKEHYALIKNDLAIEENKRGNIIRVSDEEGEWLIVDDSLCMGGELETVGKKAFQTNIPMQKWWNDNKKHKFEVTPSLLLESINKVTQNQAMFNQNFESHVKSIKQLGNNTAANTESIELLANTILRLKEIVEKK